MPNGKDVGYTISGESGNYYIIRYDTNCSASGRLLPKGFIYKVLNSFL